MTLLTCFFISIRKYIFQAMNFSFFGRDTIVPVALPVGAFMMCISASMSNSDVLNSRGCEITVSFNGGMTPGVFA